jgi:hypothetical protein
MPLSDLKLPPEDWAYLHSRGYTDEMIRVEPVYSQTDGIYWEAYSMSGQHTGTQIRTRDGKYYWRRDEKAQHLPILYGTTDDHEKLYQTGKMILVEGIFDRAAIKRCFPDRAVYARLSRGVAKHLLRLIERYATTLWTAFDQDEAGTKATLETEKKLGDRLQVHQLHFPAKDPSALFARSGERRTREILRKQLDALEFD